MSEQHLLEVKDLKKYFPVKGGRLGEKPGLLRAVDGLSFTLERGETLGIVGESGCGKSTLGNTIIRLLDPTDGQILVEGKDLARMNRK